MSFEEVAADKMLQAVEQSTGHRFQPDVRASIIQGPDEIDLVNSGLEETMITAYQRLRQIREETDGVDDLRTAAFIDAVGKIAQSYVELGVFP